MDLILHGVRGSIPVPSRKVLKYGGHTTCMEISSDTFQLIIDLGSGFKNVEIKKNIPTFIVFSHFHHDHTQGFPFNSAVYDKDIQFHISSALLNRKEILRVLENCFSPPVFPLDILDDNINFNIMNFDTFKAAAIDFFKIETFPLCHPGGASGYKVSAFNKSIVYALDHEFGLEKKIDNGLLKAALNCDVVIWDGMYTEKEIRNKLGWGHSSIEQGVMFYRKSKAKKLLISHHAPERDDKELDIMSKSVLPKGVFFAKENKTIKLI